MAATKKANAKHLFGKSIRTRIDTPEGTPDLASFTYKVGTYDHVVNGAVVEVKEVKGDPLGADFFLDLVKQGLLEHGDTISVLSGTPTVPLLEDAKKLGVTYDAKGFPTTCTLA